MPAPRGRTRDITRSDYSVVGTAPGLVFLIDHDSGTRTVTNDAERVCIEVAAAHPGSRIIYRDSFGCWDELVHERGRFIAFAPCAGVRPPRAGADPDAHDREIDKQLGVAS